MREKINARLVITAILTVTAALTIGCGAKRERALRAYDAKNRTLIVLTGERIKPARFIENMDYVIAGGGFGGIAAAVSLCSSGRLVVLIEESDRIAGCFTPGDTLSYPETAFMETCGQSKNFRLFRENILEWYTSRSLKPPLPFPGAVGAAGGGFCFTTEAAIDVIREMFEHYNKDGKLVVLLRHKIAKVNLFEHRVASVTAVDLEKKEAVLVSGWAFIDASVEGDIFRLAGAPMVAGSESRAETGEPHAPERADSLTAMDFLACSGSGKSGKKSRSGVSTLEVSAASGPGPVENGKGTYVFPVMKEPRRLLAAVRITERDISAEFNPGPRARFFRDSAGVGFHPIVVSGAGGGETSVAVKPFQIPLGTLVSPKFNNVLAGSLNIGFTRIASRALANPMTEWAVGEAAGMAASFCGGLKASIHSVLSNPANLLQFQSILVKTRSVPIYWYDDVKPGDPDFAEAQLKPFGNPAFQDSSSTLSYRKTAR